MELQLNLNPDIEKQLIEIVNKKFNGSFERFIEDAVHRRTNVLESLANIAEDLEVEDLAENHDKYLYGASEE
jgi:hypothetical protein